MNRDLIINKMLDDYRHELNALTDKELIDNYTAVAQVKKGVNDGGNDW